MCFSFPLVERVFLCLPAQSVKKVSKKSPNTNFDTFLTFFLLSVRTFLGSWAPNGSCRIMWNHGRSCKIVPLKTPESAWFCLKMPDFVVWEWLKVSESAWCPESPRTKKHKFVLNEFSGPGLRCLESRDSNHGTQSRVNREVQTVNWEAGKEGAAETGVERGLKRAHEPWKKRPKWRTNRELGKG